MPHTASDVTTDPPSFYIPRKQVYYKHNGQLYTQYYAWVPHGKHKRVKRAASTNNPKDSTGWRKPASYYYHRHTWDDDTYKPGVGFEETCSSALVWNRYPAGYYGKCPLWEWDWSDLSSEYFPAYPYDIAAVQTVRNLALQKLKAQKVNFSLALLESRKTYSMVRDIVMDLARSAIAIKRGRNPFGGRLFQKSFFGRWLEARYGWMQLVYDAAGSVEWLDKVLKGSREGMRIRVTGIHSDLYDAVRTTELTACPSHRWTARQRVQKQWKGTYWYYVKDDSFYNLNDFGFQEPHVLAWELLPGSFVADWFLPIGRYLEALMAATGMEYLGGSLTRVVTGEGIASCESLSPTVNAGWENTREQDYFHMIRAVEGSPPSPSIVPNLELFRPSGTRITDAIALLAQVFSGRR
jgi:hypothetical protein